MENRISYVAGFMFSEDGQYVALITKNKPEWQKGKLNGIGGKVEPGESSLTAMVREFKEETGVDHNEWRLFCVLQGDGFNVDCFCAFTDKVYEAWTVEAEEVSRHDVAHIPMLNTIANLQWMIPMALDETASFAIVNCK